MFYLILVIVGIYAVSKLLNPSKPSSASHSHLDYRCNADTKWDMPEEYMKLGCTDRICYHAEGDAYKQDEHKHF